LKAAAVPVEFQEHHLSEVQNMASEEKLEQVLSSMKENKVAIIGMCAPCHTAYVSFRVK
jgi:isocitrate dehydrogenase (NAD+)